MGNRSTCDVTYGEDGEYVLAAACPRAEGHRSKMVLHFITRAGSSERCPGRICLVRHNLDTLRGQGRRPGLSLNDAAAAGELQLRGAAIKSVHLK